MKHTFTAKGKFLEEEIKQQLPNLNYIQLKTIFRKKDVKVNGKRVNTNINLSNGDIVEIFYFEKESKPQIVYQDQNICVIFKKQGQETTLKDKVFEENCVEEYFLNYKAVHRLDKNTEGLVILAKDQKCYEEFLKIFKNRQINKFYLAICYGNFAKQQDVLVGYATKKDNLTKISKAKTKDSVLVKTGYTVLKQYKNLSLLQIQLFTGYTHQIRAHLTNIGCFVLGDNKYGKKEVNKKFNLKKQLLCANKLTFNIDTNSYLSYLNSITIQLSPTFNFDKICSKLECNPTLD